MTQRQSLQEIPQNEVAHPWPDDLPIEMKKEIFSYFDINTLRTFHVAMSKADHPLKSILNEYARLKYKKYFSAKLYDNADYLVRLGKVTWAEVLCQANLTNCDNFKVRSAIYSIVEEELEQLKKWDEDRSVWRGLLKIIFSNHQLEDGKHATFITTIGKNKIIQEYLFTKLLALKSDPFTELNNKFNIFLAIICHQSFAGDIKPKVTSKVDGISSLYVSYKGGVYVTAIANSDSAFKSWMINDISGLALLYKAYAGIHLTVIANNESALNMMLERQDTNVNLVAKTGYTPLTLAAELGLTNIVKILLNHPKINVGATALPLAIPTALPLAIQWGHVDIVELLVNKLNWDHHALCNDNNLKLAASAPQSEGIFNYFLNARPQNMKISYLLACRLVGTAVYHGNHDIARFLLERYQVYVNVVLSDFPGRNFLDVAIQRYRDDPTFLLTIMFLLSISNVEIRLDEIERSLNLEYDACAAKNGYCSWPLFKSQNPMKKENRWSRMELVNDLATQTLKDQETRNAEAYLASFSVFASEQTVQSQTPPERRAEKGL